MSKLQSLLEAVVDKKPHDFREIFNDVMVEKMRGVVDEYRDVVVESMFVDAEEVAEEEEEISEEDEEDESVDEEEEQLDEVIYKRPLYNKDKKSTVTLPNKKKLKSSWYKNPSPSDMGSKMTGNEVKSMDRKYKAMKGRDAGGQKEKRAATAAKDTQKQASRKAAAAYKGSADRPISHIARDISKDWGDKTHYAAKPYLKAMHDLKSAHDNYGMDSGHSVVGYFLSNASTYRGENAARHKADLKAHLKAPKK